MPSIVAVPYPTRGHVLLEINFSDIPGATNVCVEAVTGAGTDTEVRRQLHAYVSYNSDGCIALGCGQAILWDTEISCNTATQYCATAINSAGVPITTAASAIVKDTFTRVVASSLGTADSGQPWTVSSGLATDHSVNGTRGVHSTSVVNSVYEDTLNAGLPNVRVYAEAGLPVLPTGAQINARLEFRRTDANNYYAALLEWMTTGSVQLSLVKVVAGVQTFLSAVVVGTHTAGDIWSIVAQGWGSQIQLTAWKLIDPMPAAPSATYTDTSLTTGGLIGVRTRRDTGNTNGTVAVTWDNLIVSDVCAELPIVEVCTGNVTIECDGCFRLGDPVRPCNDVRICLCADGVNCGGTGGLFFAGMSPDVYASNSGNLLPVNAKYPIVVSRTRRGAAGQLDIVATSFVARDALLALLDPGGPLLWRGPAEYGTGDRYISVGDVSVAPQIADLTIQPRVMPLPFLATKAPVGPTLGVCGSRVKDLCDIYASWDAMIAAGLTWADLLRGEASPPGSGLATWDDINAQNASWNVLLVNEPDWNDVLDGD